MKGVVTRLCDISSIEIPAEMLDVSVDDARVEEEVSRLGLRYADETAAESVLTGDAVHCAASVGRDIIIFTRPVLPGAEDAAEAVIGKQVGDTITVQLLGNAMDITVKKIVRRIPAEVNDALIAGLGIEGVADVAAYKAYIKEKMLSDLRMQCSKEISHLLMDELVNGSEFDYDEAELSKYVDDCITQWMTEYADAGMDASEEEIRAGVTYQCKQEWIAESIFNKLGGTLDMEEVKAEAERMAEMLGIMGEPVPSEDELVEMSVKDAYLNAMFGYIDGIAKEKIGGSNGND